MSDRIRSKRPSKKSSSSRSNTNTTIAPPAQESRRRSNNATKSQSIPITVPDVADILLEQNEPVETPELQTLTTSRRRVNRDEVLQRFDSLLTSVETEIEGTTQNKTRMVPLKTFRNLAKDIKRLRTDTSRVMKGKKSIPKENKNTGTNSGFKKPVPVSKQMSKFANWDPNELKSRNDVTKYICNYIKENNLQNPNDRRQILADRKLAKLLDYNEATDLKPSGESQPLTYWYLQKKFSNIFCKD